MGPGEENTLKEIIMLPPGSANLALKEMRDKLAQKNTLFSLQQGMEILS